MTTVGLEALAGPVLLRGNASYKWSLSRKQSRVDRSDKSDIYVALVFTLLGLIDLALVLTVASSVINIGLALGLHVALVGVAVVLVSAIPQVDRALVAIGVPSFLLIGPFGAAGVLLVALAAGFTRPSNALLQEWYRRLSGKTDPDLAFDVYETIVEGRSIRPADNESYRFKRVINNGSLRDKQALLGHIGLKYVPEYLPTLQLALRCPEPSIRVQAAAVFVKLREQQRAKVKEYLAASQGASPTFGYERSVAQGRRLLECIDSGFLDPAEVRDGRAGAKRCLEAALRTQGTDLTAEILLCRLLSDEGDHEAVCLRLKPLLDGEDVDARRLYANSLLSLGRLDELRQVLSGRMERRNTRRMRQREVHGL
jgi:hypothetical protein